MQQLNEVEQKIAAEFADRLTKDLEAYKQRQQVSEFNSRFAGIFKQNDDGTCSIVRPKPFVVGG